MLDHPHSIDAPNWLAVYNEIRNTEHAGLDCGIDPLFQCVFGVACFDVVEQRVHVYTKVLGFAGDVVRSRDIETAHPQAAKDLLRQRLRKARIAFL